MLARPLRWLAGNRWGIVVLGLLAGTYSAIGASWLVAVGSAATSVTVVLLVREVAVRVGTATCAVWFGGVVVRTLARSGT